MMKNIFLSVIGLKSNFIKVLTPMGSAWDNTLLLPELMHKRNSSNFKERKYRNEANFLMQHLKCWDITTVLKKFLIPWKCLDFSQFSTKGHPR